MLKIITYADENFKEEQNLFNEIHSGISDQLISYGPKDIPEPYYTFWEHLKKLPVADNASWYFQRQAKQGYWFWKPVLIYHTLLNSQENDIILYADSRSRIDNYNVKETIKHVFQEKEKEKHFLPMILWKNPFPLEVVALPIMFELMNMTEEKYKKFGQWSAHGIIMKNTPRIREIVLKWIQNMMIENGRILNDDTLPHPVGFVHSCGDQPILNLTLLKELTEEEKIIEDSIVTWHCCVKDKYALPQGKPRNIKCLDVATVFYGVSKEEGGKYIDITDLLKEKCKENATNNRYSVPTKDWERDKIFTDPCPQIHKHILIEDTLKKHYKILEGQLIHFSFDKSEKLQLLKTTEYCNVEDSKVQDSKEEVQDSNLEDSKKQDKNLAPLQIVEDDIINRDIVSILYGSDNSNGVTYIDVTKIIYTICENNHKYPWSLPLSNYLKDKIFTDPCYYVKKHILINFQESEQQQQQKRKQRQQINDYEYAKFFINENGKLNVSRKVEKEIFTAQVVIALYKEDDYSFLKELYDKFSEIDIILYDKTESKPNMIISSFGFNLNVKHLANIGMEIYGYIQHIIQNYNNLYEYTFFLPGGCDSIGYKNEKYIYLLEHWKDVKIQGYVEMQHLDFYDYNFQIDYWKNSNSVNTIDEDNRNQNQKNNNEEYKLKPAKIRPLGLWYEKYVGSISVIKRTGMSYNCIFLVRKDRILQHSLDFYLNLKNQLEEGGKRSEVVHYIERIWRSLFSIEWNTEDKIYK